jgi:U4/U6 small nuclear ribonucleoprotein PRP31
MEENEMILKFITELENKNIEEGKNIIPLLEKANKYIIILNKYISEGISLLKELYSPYFPELPTIVTNSHEYVKSIKIIEENKSLLITDSKAGIKQLNQQLSFLPHNVIMALNFMLSSSNIFNNSNLNQENIVNVDINIKNNYEKILGLFDEKNTLLNFISNNMKYFAPNLTLLLGAEISAKLVTEAGGLQELSRTPSGNILNMGRHELNLEGFSTMNKFNNGYLTELKEYKDAVDSMKIKVLRRYANKTALAARKDAFINKNRNENKEKEEKYGTELKKLIEEKVEKIKNDIQPILKKPLPRPDDKPSRKRGGKRVRGIKKKFELTEVRKLKNRMKFGEPEPEYRDTGRGFGMLSVGGIGSSLRVAINKNNKIITKKQIMYDKKYGGKGINNNTEKDKDKEKEKGDNK